MKRVIGIVVCVLGITPLFTQSFMHPKVDERTELLSIVFRLASAEEYVADDLKTYMQEIDDYFAPYKEHEIMPYIRQIREVRGIGYDAVMSFAINTEIKDNTISFRSDLDRNKSLDNRWGTEPAEKFLVLLNDFYNESQFHRFFTGRQSLYLAAENNFNIVLKTIDFSWYKEFYGELPKGHFIPVVSLVNGGNCYGPSVTNRDSIQDVYAIIGSWLTDSTGMPTYNSYVTSLIIHEFNHSFCNPLIQANYAQMEKKGQEFYKLVAAEMRQQAYGSAYTMMCEILVRACEIKYMQKVYGRENRRSAGKAAMEKAMGFLWIDQLVDLLDTFNANRDKYPALRDFMLEIVKLQNSLSPKKIKKEMDKKMPKVISTNIKNNDQNVDYTLTGITVKFDRPMYTGANGASYGKQESEFMPEVIDAKWNEKNKKEWTLLVKLEPDTEYSISFPGQFFLSEDFAYGKGVYYLDFKTRK